MITQVFILGSSYTYGVGAEHTSWADLVKQYLHGKMYKEGGVGEKFEVYNFGKSGETISFVKDSFEWLIKQYGRNQKTIIIVSAGGNNTKAINDPHNYVSTPQEYEHEMKQLLTILKNSSDAVIVVDSNGYVDEEKTTPKLNPLNGSKSYFTNVRRQEFKAIAESLCSKMEIPIVDHSVDMHEWIRTYMYKDGIHPNQAGHQLIFEAIKPLLDEYVEVV